jgi:hypothetical protein
MARILITMTGRLCPRVSLISAEKPPKTAFSRQKYRHVGTDETLQISPFAALSSVEPAGIEPATSCLQSRRSPN